jgi:hypothetical protein
MLVDTFIRSCPTLSLLRPHYFWHAIANAAHTLQANVLVALAPDVILANGGAAVKTLARLGSNATGFMQSPHRQVPGDAQRGRSRRTRAPVMRDLTAPAGTGQVGAIQSERWKKGSYCRVHQRSGVAHCCAGAVRRAGASDRL